METAPNFRDGPPAKRAKTDPRHLEPTDPEDLQPGVVVYFWDDCRAVVRDAYAPLNEFWLSDEETGEVVRDEQGEIVAFKAEDLRIAGDQPDRVSAPVAKVPVGAEPQGSVLIVGTEEQMRKVLEHFGAPDATKRCMPQQLLAIPCSMCTPEQLLPVADDGIDDSIQELAKQLRPDIVVNTRAFHMENAAEGLAPELRRLEGYFCLSGVTLPYGFEEIDEAHGAERKWREEVCNQIDLHVTAIGPPLPGEMSVEETARRILGEQCAIAVADALWSKKAQEALRASLKVNLPLKFNDASDGQCVVLLLPGDAEMKTEEGVLVFEGGKSLGKLAGDKTMGGKTLKEWEEAQAQFADLPALPEGWLRIQSRNNNQIYYLNKETQVTTFEIPRGGLPEDWTKQVSKSSGKTYYFNAKKRLSQFEKPTA